MKTRSCTSELQLSAKFFYILINSTRRTRQQTNGVPSHYSVPATTRANIIKKSNGWAKRTIVHRKVVRHFFNRLAKSQCLKVSKVFVTESEWTSAFFHICMGQTLGRYLINGGPPKSDRKKNIIYKIPCTSCNFCYNGETSQWFDEREKQHKRCVKNCDSNNGMYKHL